RDRGERRGALGDRPERAPRSEAPVAEPAAAAGQDAAPVTETVSNPTAVAEPTGAGTSQQTGQEA
ncbi:hypothetical protein, partial [Aquipuribacter nitratireducens]